MTKTAKGDEIFFHIAIPDGFLAEGDGPGDFWSFRIVGIANHRAGARADKAPG